MQTDLCYLFTIKYTTKDTAARLRWLHMVPRIVRLWLARMVRMVPVHLQELHRMVTRIVGLKLGVVAVQLWWLRYLLYRMAARIVGQRLVAFQLRYLLHSLAWITVQRLLGMVSTPLASHPEASSTRHLCAESVTDTNTTLGNTKLVP